MSYVDYVIDGYRLAQDVGKMFEGEQIATVVQALAVLVEHTTRQLGSDINDFVALVNGVREMNEEMDLGEGKLELSSEDEDLAN